MKDVDPYTLCMELVRCEKEKQVEDVLVSYGLCDDHDYWADLGGIENNGGLVNSQQSDPKRALVELLINAIDANLLKECKKRDIDPQGKSAPKSTIEARKAFYDISPQRYEEMGEPQRTKLAENICHFVITGADQAACCSIADHGEGQSPENFPNTFLAISSANKSKTHFVQGKYCIGSVGVLKFSKSGFRLIISRRNHELSEQCNSNWGFTLIREFEPEALGSRTSTYKYLHSGTRKEDITQVFNFACPKGLPLLPGISGAYEKPLISGTFTKLYEYQNIGRAKATLDLSFRLQSLLVNLILPVRVYERRLEKMKGHSHETTLKGLRLRLEHEGVLRNGYPKDGIFTIKKFGKFHYSIWVLSKREDRKAAAKLSKSKSPPYQKHRLQNEAIIFTLNGQQHFRISQHFLQKDVALPYLAPYLIVEVDCSELGPNAINNLFKTDRENISKEEDVETLKEAIKKQLLEFEELKELERQLREEKLATSVAKNADVKRELENLLSKDEKLTNLLLKGKEIPSHHGGSVEGKDIPVFVGKYSPTFLREIKKTTLEKPKSCSIGHITRFQFDTDATNGYLTRRENKGNISITCEEFERNEITDWIVSNNLNDGRLNISILTPEDLAPNLSLSLTFAMQDDTIINPVETTCFILTQKIVQSSGTQTDVKPKKNGLKVPQVVSVKRNNDSNENSDTWASNGSDETFDERTLVRVVDSQGELAIFVNADHRDIENERRKMKGPSAPENTDLLQTKFETSAAIMGLIAKQYEIETPHYHNEARNETDEKIEDIFASAIVPLMNLGKDLNK